MRMIRRGCMIDVSNKNAVLFNHGKAEVYNNTCIPCGSYYKDKSGICILKPDIKA
jgi:hypothetical protein